MPILRDFRFKLEYVPNKILLEKIMSTNQCSYEEAARLEYEKNWKEKTIQFDNQTRGVLALYTRLFSKYKTNDCKIIVFSLVKKITDSRLLNFDGIYELQIQYDYDEFFNLSVYDKKRETLEILKKGLDIIIEQKQWNKSLFDEAYNKVIEVDYSNQWKWKKTIMSPTKEYSSIVFCENKVESFDISIIIYNKKGEELKREKVLSLIPQELVFNIYLGDLKWVSENKVSLINEFGTKQWSVKVD